MLNGTQAIKPHYQLCSLVHVAKQIEYTCRHCLKPKFHVNKYIAAYTLAIFQVYNVLYLWKVWDDCPTATYRQSNTSQDNEIYLWHIAFWDTTLNSFLWLVCLSFSLVCIVLSELCLWSGSEMTSTTLKMDGEELACQCSSEQLK